ncbi:hypothetical protein ACFFX1_54805 [Dactylosporangium sucinum]|uniref:Uncharacterized protein n=1 Tax=Dactylosporangium sucinum TaxID=1424081 RepID=A0A917U408_9ACTN|nr:hypothetical protein [Dactylosporangium sucinum]GGM53601.1 hypothetical protein GCM10007977_063980 [Dactylosporangium sucinum]
MTAVLPPRAARARTRRVVVRRHVTADPPDWPAVPTVGGPWQARTRREAQALAVGYTAGLASARRDIETAYWRGRESLAAEIMPAIRWAWATVSPAAQLAAWRDVQRQPWAEIRDRHLRAIAAVEHRRRFDTTTDVPRPGDHPGREAA